MSRLWNKAYVQAHFPGAYISHLSKAGSLTKAWHVRVPGMPDVAGPQTWHFSANNPAVAWRRAAEAVENQLRKRRVDSGAQTP